VKKSHVLCGLLGNCDQTFVNFLKEKARKRETTLERQLSAVSYLWEICYDLMLAHSENMADIPGFEALGSRNRRSTIDVGINLVFFVCVIYCVFCFALKFIFGMMCSCAPLRIVICQPWQKTYARYKI
jgi:hypothetical protein